MEKYIIDKYKDYNVTEIQSGYRCKTFLLSNCEEKYIYQIYIGETKYQAKKKEYITNLIKQDIEIAEVPNIIDYGENDEYSYLVSEYKEGFEFGKIIDKEYDYKTFYKCLAYILLKIHSIDIGTSFGWIGIDGLDEKKTFYEYIENEIKRNLSRIQKLDIDENIIVELENKANKSLEKIKNIKNIKPVISWYDINENNILVNEKTEITGFVDAGGARFAPKEWELAFIKMDLVRKKDEFEYFKNIYTHSGEIDEELLQLLTVIVELDDIAFQLEAKVKLPIAYESNFREIIENFHKEM